MGECKMGYFKAGAIMASFMQEMLHNKFLLLAVLLAVSAATYLGVGLVVLLGH
jgi:hypothetical protein